MSDFPGSWQPFSRVSAFFQSVPISANGDLAVYGVDNDFDDTLVRSTQSILHSMAELSHDLTEFLNTHFHGLISRASKMAIRLMLAHHHVSPFRVDMPDTDLTVAVCGLDN